MMRALSLVFFALFVVLVGWNNAYAQTIGINANTRIITRQSGATGTVRFEYPSPGWVDPRIVQAYGSVEALTVGSDLLGSLPNGRTFPIAARAPVAWSNIARALGPIGALVGTSILLNDWLTDAGIRYANGQWQQQSGPPPASQAGSGAWTGYNDQRLGYATPEAACQVRFASPDWEFRRVSGTGAQRDCVFRWYFNGNELTPGQVWINQTICPFGSPDPTGRCPYTPTWQNVTDFDSEAAPRLAANPPPSQDAPDIWRDVMDRGGTVPEVPPPSLSGPSSVPGSSSTQTHRDAQGNVTGTSTTTTTYNINYSNNTYNITTTTTTVNPDGSTTTTTDQEPPGEDALPVDSPLPQVPDLYEQKYPDGISGVWATFSDQLTQSPLFSIIPSLTPNLGDGGCPQWQLPLNLGIVNYGTHDISVPCWVWSAVRVIIILSALFAARRIMFGG